MFAYFAIEDASYCPPEHFSLLYVCFRLRRTKTRTPNKTRLNPDLYYGCFLIQNSRFSAFPPWPFGVFFGFQFQQEILLIHTFPVICEMKYISYCFLFGKRGNKTCEKYATDEKQYLNASTEFSQDEISALTAAKFQWVKQ